MDGITLKNFTIELTPRCFSSKLLGKNWRKHNYDYLRFTYDLLTNWFHLSVHGSYHKQLYFEKAIKRFEKSICKHIKDKLNDQMFYGDFKSDDCSDTYAVAFDMTGFNLTPFNFEVSDYNLCPAKAYFKLIDYFVNDNGTKEDLKKILEFLKRDKLGHRSYMKQFFVETINEVLEI